MRASEPARKRPVQQRLKQVLGLTQGFARGSSQLLMLLHQRCEFELQPRVRYALGSGSFATTDITFAEC